MELLVNKLGSGIFQVLLFSALPFVWWVITARKSEGFFQWPGIRKVVADKGFAKTFVLVFSVFLGLSVGILFVLRGVDMATSEFSGRGPAALPEAIVYAFVSTALSEEIIFRGFC